MAELAAVRAQDPAAKVLLFTGFDATMSRLAQLISAAGVGCRAVAGGAPAAQHAAAVAQFNEDPDVGALLLTVHAGSAGLNLTAANHIFLVDPPLNHALELQAVGRCHRIGQGRAVVLRKFVAAGTVEEVMAEAAAARGGHAAPAGAASGAAPRRAAVRGAGRGASLLDHSALLRHFGIAEDEAGGD